MPRNADNDIWSLDPADPNAPHNARVAWALLRCVRKLPKAMPEHMFGDLGQALAPLVPGLRARPMSALRRCLAELRDRGLTDGPEDLLDDDQDDPMPTWDWGTRIGRVMAEGRPGLRPVFVDMEKQLRAFLEAAPPDVDRNVRMLAEVLGLRSHEQAFLELLASVSQSSMDRGMFSWVSRGALLCRAMEALLGIGLSEADRMFRPDGALAQSGLVEMLVSHQSAGDMDDLLAPSALGQRLLTVPFASPADMAAAVLRPVPSRSGDGAAFTWPHLALPQSLLVAALRAALDNGLTGINILLHGGPGTGKTEFAYQLVQSADASGFLVDHVDRHGDEGNRADRLASLRLNQCFAGQRARAVLVLDEAEDVFQNDYQSPLSRVFGGKKESKAWTNHLLESNLHPVIWITNQAHYLDPAYMRRFTVCLEFPRTPLSMRRQIAEHALSAVGCSGATIEAIAQDEHSTPASLAAAACFARLASQGGQAPDAAATVHLRQQARAAGHREPVALARRTQRFDLRYLNLAGHAQPHDIVQALRQDPSAALMFSGPPGTGKTQFAAELAQSLNKRLVVRTASDINSMWYGQSEANVAEMFRRCDAPSELLLLDEAEVLLAPRESVGHRADRAVTAEFLRWLEVFDGTFICATNHPGDLDAALMRRFMFRVRFQALTPAQRCAMFCEQALGWRPDAAQPMPVLPPDVASRLAQLDLLTPGDFANAGRRVRRLGLDAAHWLDELEAEQAAKRPTGLTRIGFV